MVYSALADFVKDPAAGMEFGDECCASSSFEILFPFAHEIVYERVRRRGRHSQ